MWTVLDIVVSSSDAINVVSYNCHLYSAQVKQQESPFNESTSNRRSEPWLVKWCCPLMYKHVYSITRKLGVRRCEDGQLVGDPRRGSTCRVCQDRPQVSCGEFCQRWVNGWHPEGIYDYIYIHDYILYTCLVWRNSQEILHILTELGQLCFFFSVFWWKYHLRGPGTTS